MKRLTTFVLKQKIESHLGLEGQREFAREFSCHVLKYIYTVRDIYSGKILSHVFARNENQLYDILSVSEVMTKFLTHDFVENIKNDCDEHEKAWSFLKRAQNSEDPEDDYRVDVIDYFFGFSDDDGGLDIHAFIGDIGECKAEELAKLEEPFEIFLKLIELSSCLRRETIKRLSKLTKDVKFHGLNVEVIKLEDVLY